MKFLDGRPEKPPKHWYPESWYKPYVKFDCTEFTKAMIANRIITLVPLTVIVVGGLFMVMGWWTILVLCIAAGVIGGGGG